jgi:hypothetical protein
VSLIRRVRGQFELQAPRVARRTSMPWWGRVAVLVTTAAVFIGMWWWGFDLGQLFGGVNRKELEARVTALDGEAARLRTETADLRMRTSRLESDLAMSRGAEQAMSKQATDLVAENAQLKEEVAFLQKLVSDSSKQAGLTIPRLSADPEPGGAAWRYRLFVVRGGNPSGDFEGHVVLEATLAGPEGDLRTLTLPDDQPDSRAPLALRFKYYQRIEGTLALPPGARLQSLTARAYEDGNATPRATRSLTTS